MLQTKRSSHRTQEQSTCQTMRCFSFIQPDKDLVIMMLIMFILSNSDVKDSVTQTVRWLNWFTLRSRSRMAFGCSYDFGTLQLSPDHVRHCLVNISKSHSMCGPIVDLINGLFACNYCFLLHFLVIFLFLLHMINFAMS